jgi:hypothetical protein
MVSKLKVVLGAGAVVFVLAAFMLPPAAYADPCLTVYTDSPCTYHYDPAEYYTVGPGDPLYDPMFDRGGEVLIDINSNEIAYNVYQAANLTGFVMDAVNQGFFTTGTDLDVVVDGFNNAPTTYVNIILVFDRVEPSWCQPAITVNGNPVSYQAGLGWYYPIGDLVVTTPTPYGNNYSDVVIEHVVWGNCSGVRIWAFADLNHDLKREAGECFSAFSHDLTVPAQESTWGAIKGMYTE